MISFPKSFLLQQFGTSSVLPHLFLGPFNLGSKECSSHLRLSINSFSVSPSYLRLSLTGDQVILWPAWCMSVVEVTYSITPRAFRTESELTCNRELYDRPRIRKTDTFGDRRGMLLTPLWSFHFEPEEFVLKLSVQIESSLDNCCHLWNGDSPSSLPYQEWVQRTLVPLNGDPLSNNYFTLTNKSVGLSPMRHSTLRFVKQQKQTLLHAHFWVLGTGVSASRLSTPETRNEWTFTRTRRTVNHS